MVIILKYETLAFGEWRKTQKVLHDFPGHPAADWAPEYARRINAGESGPDVRNATAVEFS